MKNVLAIALFAIGLSGSVVGSLRAEVTAEQVRQAIDRGVKYLMSQQHNNGSWDDPVGYHGGISALCTLALLNAGVEPSDPKIQKALEHLRGVKSEMTYVVSLQTMVFARAEPERDRLLIGNNVRWLQSTQITRAPLKGAWSYSGPSSPGGDGDNSNSQFAALGVARGRTRRRAGRRTHVEPGREVLGGQPERGWLLGLPPNDNQFGQHDLRRHQLVGDRRRQGAVDRRAR